MADSIILPHDHYFLNHAVDLDHILSPLKRLGITVFTFMRKFSDTTQIYISNNANWVVDYFNNALYGQFISRSLSTYKEGFILYPSDSPLDVFKLARERYDSVHGATYVKPYKDFVDFYFFSGSYTQQHLLDLFVNDSEIFKKFILYFQDRAELIITKAYDHKILLENTNQKNTDLSWSCINEKDIHSVMSEMRVRKYRFKNDPYKDIVLSSRELDVIFCFLNRMATKDIATCLNISQRTVEAYFDNIKLKLSCFSKAEILKILKSDGFPID